MITELSLIHSPNICSPPWSHKQIQDRCELRLVFKGELVFKVTLRTVLIRNNWRLLLALTFYSDRSLFSVSTIWKRDPFKGLVIAECAEAIPCVHKTPYLNFKRAIATSSFIGTRHLSHAVHCFPWALIACLPFLPASKSWCSRLSSGYQVSLSKASALLFGVQILLLLFPLLHHLSVLHFAWMCACLDNCFNVRRFFLNC